MRKTLFASAALCAFSGAAMASPSVDVFGTLDLAVRQVNSDPGSLTTVGTNGASTSKIGIRADDDLGGGWKGNAWLEAQVDPAAGAAGGSNGTATVFWNRRSTASLLGPFGEVRLGRDYVPTFSAMADFDPFNTNGVGNSLNLINQDSLGSGVVTQTRANNAVSYFLPEKLGGFYGNVMLTRSGGLPGQKYTGARFGYANGPLKLQAALGQTETATSSTPKFKQSNVAVSYNIGVARLVSFVNVNEYDVKKATVYMLGAFVPVGADEIHVAFLNRKSSGGGTDANGANQFTLGYLHNFTKDTTVYANMGRLSNSGGSNFTQTGGPAAGSRTGFGSTGIEIGYRRFF